MIRRPPRSTLDRSSAASDVYKRQPFTRDAITLSTEEIDFRRMLDDEMETPEEQVYVTQFNRKKTADGFKVEVKEFDYLDDLLTCLLYTSPSPRDRTRYRMPSSA